MPVLVTIATISILFRGGSTVSFLDPAMLRDQLEDELEESAARDDALLLVDKLEQLAGQYDTSLAASVEAYVTESANAESTAEDLIEILEPAAWRTDATRGIAGLAICSGGGGIFTSGGSCTVSISSPVKSMSSAVSVGKNANSAAAASRISRVWPRCALRTSSRTRHPKPD